MIWLICPIFRFPLAAFPLRQFSPKQLKERQIRLSQELPSYFLPFTVGLNVVLPHAAAGGQGGGNAGAYRTRACAASHSRARRWASVLCDQVHRGSVRCVMVRFVTGLYTAIINCG